MPKVFKNVAEAWTLYDTVLVSSDATVSGQNGWYGTFALLGAAQNINFFNVRNRQVGLPWNNQDTRDALAFPFVVYGLSVQFFGPAIKTQVNAGDAIEDHTAHIWEAELSRHVSVELQVQQDIKVETTAMMCPPGFGAVGGAYGGGDFQTGFAAVNPTIAMGIVTQSKTHINNRWKFPKPIEIPRRANVSAVLRFTEYATQLLQTMPGPANTFIMDVDGAVDVEPSLFGIRVDLVGQRQVQQRGQYHA